MLCRAIKEEEEKNTRARNKGADDRCFVFLPNSWKPRTHSCGQIGAPPTSLIKPRNGRCQRRRAISVQTRHQVSLREAKVVQRLKRATNSVCLLISNTHFKKIKSIGSTLKQQNLPRKAYSAQTPARSSLSIVPLKTASLPPSTSRPWSGPRAIQSGANFQ